LGLNSLFYIRFVYLDVRNLPHSTTTIHHRVSVSVLCIQSRTGVSKWLPKLDFTLIQAAQVTGITFEENHVKALNDVFKFLKATPNIFLRYSPLDRRTLRMVFYSDASLKNLVDYRSQLGYVILLSDASNRCYLRHHSSCKSKRVTRTSMAAETLAFPTQ
jgi:hypothetical protein